jgi:hypothetical protein
LRRRVSQYNDTCPHRRHQTGCIRRMDEDRSSPAVAFLRQSLNDAVGRHGTVPIGRHHIKLEAVSTSVKQLPRDPGRLGRVRHPRQLNSLVGHETRVDQVAGGAISIW